jgi:hypothetical protein
LTPPAWRAARHPVGTDAEALTTAATQARTDAEAAMARSRPQARQPIRLTTNEWFKATQLGDTYWLYVVWDPLGRMP